MDEQARLCESGCGAGLIAAGARRTLAGARGTGVHIIRRIFFDQVGWCRLLGILGGDYPIRPLDQIFWLTVKTMIRQEPKILNYDNMCSI